MKGDQIMKQYKNPEIEILKLMTSDLLMASGEVPPEVDSLEQPNGTPVVPLF